jgi:hypothetical protein
VGTRIVSIWKVPNQNKVPFFSFYFSLLPHFLGAPVPSHVLANSPGFFFSFFVDLHILLTMPFPDAEHGRMRTGKDI